MSIHLDIDLDVAQVDIATDLPSVDIAADLPSVDIGVPGSTGPPGPTGVVEVNHGTNPNVPRPDVPLVYWVGTVVPIYALPTDFYTGGDTLPGPPGPPGPTGPTGPQAPGVLLLEHGAAVPPGTPAGTVIFEKAV